MFRKLGGCSLLLIAVLTLGCNRSDRRSPENAANDKQTDTKQPEGEPEVLLEPFDPPTLEELNAKVEWLDSPVVDAFDERLALHEKPLVTVQQALAMKNNSAEDNKKILSVLGLLAPESEEKPNYEAVINRSAAQDTRSMNPLLASSVQEAYVQSLIGFGLFGFDWNLVPFASPDYVVSWQTSKDRMYDKVVLRDDLTWSDGKPITAHDVAFSFQTIMNPKIPIPAVRQGTKELRWVEAYDDHTVVYFQKRAEPINVWNINFPIIPKHIYENSIKDDYQLTQSEYHQKLENNPVCGGPYTVTTKSRGSEIVLERRQDWYMHNGKEVRRKPYFKTVRFIVIEDGNTRRLALQSGEIDECELIAQQWYSQTNGDDFYKLNTKVTGPEWTYFYIGWNQKRPFFADKNVRHAMSYTMNHQEMLDSLCYGLYQPCYGPFNPDSWMYPKSTAEPLGRFNHQDLDKAEDLLDAAGWADSDGDGIRDKEIDGKLVPFEFTLLVSSKPDRIAICNLFRENLESIGITCNVRPMEAAAFQDRVFNRDFDAAFSGWGSGADPYTNENIFKTGADRNYGGYSNKEVDELFKAGMQEFDREKRGAIYGKMHELVYEEQPYMFLFYRASFYGFNKKLRGYKFSPRGPYSYSPGFDSIWSVD